MLSNDQFLNKGRYRIVSTFGQDGAGGTYEAYDTVSETTVVLKETVGSFGKVATSSQMEAINEAFLGGAKTLVEIKHESLVSVQDYFSDIDRQYLVLEPVTGFDLSKFLQSGEKRPALPDVLSWADQLLNALQYLHTRPTPIIHGDVRPENIKLTSGSTVKLLTSYPHIDDSSNLITLAPIRSTEDTGVNYRPLEQIWDGLDTLSQRVILNHYDEESERWLLQPLSAATDLYSLGATVYSVLTGTVPPDALDRSIAALEGKPDPLTVPSELNSAIPAEISDVLLKSMSLRREDRFYSAAILRQILNTAVVKVKEREAKDGPVLNLDIRIIEEPPTSDPSPGIQNLLDAEARRLEIEAEQERLESERKALEKRRLELDAEVEQQRAEQERMEREAEEARLKLEAQQLAADRERERLENEKKQREEDEARELAAKILAKKEAENNTPLLELEPVKTPLEPAVDLSEVLDAPERSEFRESSATDNREVSVDFGMADSDYQPSGSKWRVPAIAIVVVLLAGGSFGVWKMTSSNPAAVSTSVASQPVSVPQQTEVPPPVSDDRHAAEPTPSPAVETVVTSEPETVTHDKNARPVQPTAEQDKAKKQAAPAPAKTPAPKKVTVDDLINDH
ncbi:MAG TPA: protein kinase [Pyrinomonadaceae bacterium]|nr:protein kinase [Pyrinomonadaceae bacterium]